MHVLHVVGARPNFMKVAPVYRALAVGVDFRQTLIHTGQHYDALMSDVFFEQLGICAPSENLEVGSGTHAWQTAEVMTRFESVLPKYQPDVVLVYGDVNSTLAAALVCSKLQVPVAHVEAGLRSFDRTMPEEINRVLTDQLADLHFTPSREADQNLLNEGIIASKLRFVGNVMIDSVVRLLPLARGSFPSEIASSYGLVTLHRPSNVDQMDVLRAIIEALVDISDGINLYFPVHPRTRERIARLGGARGCKRLHLLDPMPYLTFLGLQQHARFVITDSGGIQEETTFLGVPCFTLRENTERPITVTHGTNILIGHDMERLRFEIDLLLQGHRKMTGEIPPRWDGHAGERIAAALRDYLGPPGIDVGLNTNAKVNTNR